MKLNYGSDNKTALQAKFDAQKIAFGPIMFQAARALRELGILELIRSRRKEGIEMEELARELDLSIYGVKVLLEAGLSMELLFAEEGKFKLTKTGWHILKDELTKVNMDFTHDVNYLGMFELVDSIRTGTPAGLKTFGEWDTVYEGLSQLDPQVQKSWFAFDHFYSDYSFSEILPRLITPGVKQILDVGGNTGKFAIRCAKWNEDVHITILDLPGQLEKAKANIEKEGLSDRITCMPLNLLDHTKKFPAGMDVIWMSQFLDCFSKEDIRELLRRSREAMDSSAALFIMELLWDRQRFEASTYSLHATSLYFTNIANGCSQMYHSQDLLDLIDQSGMIVADSTDNIGISHSLLKCTLKS